MHKNHQKISGASGKRCAVCGGRFGMVRHYMWRAALCSRNCCERFRIRELSDLRWLGRDPAA